MSNIGRTQERSGQGRMPALMVAAVIALILLPMSVVADDPALTPALRDPSTTAGDFTLANGYTPPFLRDPGAILATNPSDIAPERSVATNYNCLPTHCYGIQDWSGNVSGAFTEIDATTMSYDYDPQKTGATEEILTSELWLIDDHSTIGPGSPDCSDNPYYHACWVEAGLIATSDIAGGGVLIFSAYVSPAQRLAIYRQDTLNPAPKTSLDTFFQITIQQGSSTGQWVAGVYAPGLLYSSQDFINTTMQPNRIQVGQEIAGTSGAHAGRTKYVLNKWRDPGSTTWYYQGANGSSPPPNNPPYAAWEILPSDSSVGGVFFAFT